MRAFTRTCAVILTAITPAIAALPCAAATDYTFTWGHPRPQGNALGGAAFESNSIGYAVGDRGVVVKTTDGGLGWSLVSRYTAGVPDFADVAVVAPGTLIAVGTAPGIFRSTDGGANWTPVTNPSTGRLVDIEFITPGVLSIVGTGGQVLRSNDNGATWSLLAHAGPDLAEQYWFNATSGYVLGHGGARRTTNGGASWSAIPGIPDGQMYNEVFFTDPMHGWIIEDFTQYVTTNGGVSWSGDFFTGGLVYCGNVIALDASHFLLATNFEGAMIGRTDDAGVNWENVMFSGADGFLDFDRLPDGTLIVVGSEGDIYRSTDGGATWSNRIVGLEPSRSRIGGMGVGPAGLGAAGTSGTPGEQWYRTVDGGASWTPDPSGPGIAFTGDILYWDAMNGIAGGDDEKVWRTADGGATWTAVMLPGAPPFGHVWHLSLAAPGVAFATVTGQIQSFVYRTTDAGASWHQRSSGIPSSGGLTGISFTDSANGFVSGYTSGGVGRMFRTVNGGASWTQVTPAGLPPGYTWDLQFLNATTGLATTSSAPGGIYRTTDAGANWTRVSTSGFDMSFSDAMHGVAGGDTWSGGSVIVTEDGGITWQTVQLPSTRAGSSVTALPDGFLAGGGAGTIIRATRVATSVTGGDPETGGLASPGPGSGDVPVHALLRAAPSIGPDIAIEFELAREGRATLDIVDVQGRRVTTLRSGDFAAGARATVRWDGSRAAGGRAASGVYFARLAEADHASAIRVVLTR